jgi:LmbE family N-acetylglucosaminyl deacetylase
MLYLFSNRIIKQSTVLVLSPHPDDAEIAAYGLYSKANDSTTFIATITAGEAGAKTYDELYEDDLTHFTKKGELRVWNSIVIPMLGGILPGHAVNLGYFDGMLSDMYNTPGDIIASRSLHSSDINRFRKMNYSNTLVDSVGASSWNNLVSDLSKLIMAIHPDIIVSPYPANSNHPDHKLTTVALFEAIRNTGLKKGEVYLYANDNIPGGNFYPYGYIYSSILLPPHFKKSLYFNSIYCQSLSLNEQNDKLLALEAMNDLRPDTEWRSSKGSIRKAARTTFKNMFGLDRSYYRRAIRSNEVFFVIEMENLYDVEILNEVQGLK